MTRLPALAATCACLPVWAMADVACFGDAPVWRVETSGATATMTFRGPSQTFDVPSVVQSLNDPAIHAYSLIGSRDTAILIVAPGTCNATGLTAQLLTQEAGQPIVLSGCCTAK